MTKISKKAAYPIKKPIKSDYFIGSDSEDFGRTVNFDFKDATAVINELNGQSVIGYQFKTASDVLVGVLEEAEFYSLGNETTISDITKLYVNKFTKNSLNLSNLYNYLLVNSGDFLFKLQGTDPNVYVYFNLASIENHSDYYIFNVTLYKGNAVLPELISFGEYFFNFELKSIGSGSGSDPLKLDKDGYTGTAKDIDDRILVLENQTDVDNAFITKPTFSLSANTLTIDALGKWKLEGVIYENPASVAFPITLCTAGKTRLDYFVPNNANGFTKVSGIETLGLAIAPQLPNENIYVTYVLVTDSGVGEPVIPPAVVTPNLQQVLESGFSTTKRIWFWNTLNSKCTRFASDHILFQKLESVFNFIRADNTTQSYNIQLPNKIGGAEQTFAMVSDLTKSQVGLSNVDNTSDATKPVSGPQQAALDSKLDASAYNEHFKGKYTSSGALTTAYPTATDGDYAIVDAGTGVDAKEWIWDNEAGWIVGGATGASTTDALPEGSTNLYWTVARFLANLTYANVISALGFTPSTAPNNAQKNSDITKAEIEAKLTGEITTHTHPESGSSETYYNNIMHIGNSLTTHAIDANWWGTWGMAATVMANDYVHRLHSMLLVKNPATVSTPLSIYQWEQNYATFDKTILDSYLVGKDLVILRLGENVSYYADFQNQYKILVQYIQSKAPTARIILGGLFWTNATKENAMKAVADELGLTWFSVNHLDTAAYKSSIGTLVYGNDNAWHAITNQAVADHPSDFGMLQIAQVIHATLGYTETVINKSQDIEADKLSPSKYVSVKALYDWANPRLTGLGDMLMGTAQTVTALKTFLNGTIGFRNIANTFTSVFANAATAARTYTFQDKSYTVADNADLAGKQTGFTGVVNYITKSLTASTLIVSRLFDDGTFFGIGTVLAPTKDLTLGNQANRIIGIEQSDNNTKGRDLRVEAGRTINFVPNNNFSFVSGVTGMEGWAGTTNGDIFYSQNFQIYKQTGGSGAFVSMGQTSRDYRGMCSDGTNVYVVVYGGFIYKLTGGTGTLAAYDSNNRIWTDIAYSVSGNLYATTRDAAGAVYKQTALTGSFADLGLTIRHYGSVAISPANNVYVVGNNVLYKQTNETGSFTAVSGVTTAQAVAVSPTNNDVYVANYTGQILKQSLESGSYTDISSLVPVTLAWRTIDMMPNGNVYLNGDYYGYYVQVNYTIGAPNIDGGTLKLVTGTGKGTGNNNIEAYTGQKTTSGTNMQVETLRMKIDNEGKTTFYGIINLKGYTVSTLPTGVVGDTAYITDATSPTFLSTVVGGGSVKCRVFFDGTNWIVN